MAPSVSDDRLNRGVLSCLVLRRREGMDPRTFFWSMPATWDLGIRTDRLSDR